MDFNNQLFRCSSLGKLMTNPRSNSETLSKTTMTYLNEVLIEAVYGRKKDISNKYLEKGLLMEEDALGLLSEYEDKLLIKNKESFENDFISGTPDNVQGIVRDTKCSWDIFTFFGAEFSKDYEWQLRGYMALTGLKKATLAYCLVDSPDHLIEDEKRRLLWKLGLIDGESSSEYMEACAQIEKNMTYKDIPVKERVKLFHLEHDEDKMIELYECIADCRVYLNNLYEAIKS